MPSIKGRSAFTRSLRTPARLSALLLAALCATCASPNEPAGAYRLGVDDVVSVHVLYHPELSIEAATVGPDGRISVPIAGNLVVAGLRTEEVAAAIAAALAAELRDPHVTVRLEKRHVEPIYVLGAVRAPGAVEVRAPVSVTEAIALAQGLTAGASGCSTVVIGADGRERRSDRLSDLAGGGDPGVAPGETLLVSVQYLATVIGRVAQPGRYPVEKGDRVAELLAAAGGLRDDASPEGSLLHADGSSEALDLAALFERGESGPPVEPGMIVVVPEETRRVALVGAFSAPGKYDFDAGDRVSDALALGGGIADDAMPQSAVLMSGDGESRPINVEAILQAQESAEDPALRDGDTIVVPRATERVAVVGMVIRPGPMLLEPRMTLMEAIAAAGGWHEEAHPEKTVLWRQGGDGPEMRQINAEKLLRGAAGAENPALTGGDIIYVPRDPSMTTDELSRLLLGVAGLMRIAF